MNVKKDRKMHKYSKRKGKMLRKNRTNFRGYKRRIV